MSDALPFLTIALAGLAGIGLAAGAALRGWNDWLELRRMRIQAGASGAGRPRIGELRERVRRLEAIASGVPD